MRRLFVPAFLVITLISHVFQGAPALCAQVRGISVSSDNHISWDSPTSPFFESFLAINPRDPNNLIATSMLVADGVVGTRLYVSLNGGRTWARSKTGLDSKGGDPVVYFDANGTAFFASINNPHGLSLCRSEDGGLTWQSPVTLPGKGWDREYVAFDNTGGKFNGRMYIAGTNTVTEVDGTSYQAIFITFSTDRGLTFSPGVVLAGRRAEVSDLVVTPEGKLVILFEASSTGTSPGEPITSATSDHLCTVVSEDGGVTFAPAQIGPSVTAAGGFRMLKSTGAPRAAIDLSLGRYRGRIYFAWSDFADNRYVVKMVYSDDLGRTWSRALVVNDNANQNEPATAAVVVNNDGIVGVAFNDRRDDPENSCFRLYFTASLDGGQTFLPNIKASDQPTCPLASPNSTASVSSFIERPFDLTKERPRPVVALSGASFRWPNGGDTQGLVAGPDGVFQSAYISGGSGVMQLWWKKLTVDRAAAVQSPFINPRRNLSRDLALEVSEPRIDVTTHTVSVNVRLVNLSSSTISGPFTVVLDDLLGTLKGMRVTNSDNGMPARGAAWNFTTGGQPSLRPYQKSDTRVLHWEFLGDLSFEEARLPFYAYWIILGERI